MLPDSGQPPRASEHSSEHAETARNQFLERMNRLWTALGVDSDAKLAGKLGLKQQTISAARTRKQIPSAWIQQIAEQFEISSDWLLFGTGAMHRGEPAGTCIPALAPDGAQEPCLKPEDFVVVPLLESWVRGGPEGGILYEGIAEYYPFKRWWIERIAGKAVDRQKALLLVKVRGDSMSPTINQGEIALVDTWESERINVRTGDIYVVTLPDGSTTVKRLTVARDESGRFKVVCMSDNLAAYRPFEFWVDPAKRLQDYVLGRVRWVGKEFD